MISLVSVIIVCSVIQSFFGIGILFVGTPLLILLGYPFHEALFVLLPCSMSVSLLQSYEGRRSLGAIQRRFLMIGLPFLAFGCLLAYQGAIFSSSLKPLIGVLILITAILRLSSSRSVWVQNIFKKYQSGLIAFISLIHGMTNMGGGIWTALVSSIYTEKVQIRSNVAFGYLIMASIQFLLLLVVVRPAFAIHIIILPMVSVATYCLFGNRIFRLSPQPIYQHLMSLFLVALAIKMIIFY